MQDLLIYKLPIFFIFNTLALPLRGLSLKNNFKYNIVTMAEHG